MHCGLCTADYGLCTVHCGLRTVDCGLRTTDCALCTADYGLWTVHCGLCTTDYGLWTVHCGLWTVDCASRGSSMVGSKEKVGMSKVAYSAGTSRDGHWIVTLPPPSPRRSSRPLDVSKARPMFQTVMSKSAGGMLVSGSSSCSYSHSSICSSRVSLINLMVSSQSWSSTERLSRKFRVVKR